MRKDINIEAYQTRWGSILLNIADTAGNLIYAHEYTCAATAAENFAAIMNGADPTAWPGNAPDAEAAPDALYIAGLMDGSMWTADPDADELQHIGRAFLNVLREARRDEVAAARVSLYALARSGKLTDQQLADELAGYSRLCELTANQLNMWEGEKRRALWQEAAAADTVSTRIYQGIYLDALKEAN